jgi:(heptosyl)LPS beta-1,4-glucosyltransferase
VGKISVVINTLNEEKNLPKVLKSVKDIADEIVVVDAKSTDKTVEIAKRYGARVFNYEKEITHVEPARNFAVEKAKGEWILILDADEKLGKGLKSKLKQIASEENSSDYYRLPRKNLIFDKWIKHSRWWPDYNIRFFRKGYVTWGNIIHSVPTTKGVGADLTAKESLAIVHHHYESISQYITRMNRYASVQAKEMVKDGYKFSWRDLITKPSGEFFSRYFQGRGYKDGLHGLILALLQAVSEFAKYANVWEAQGFEKKSLEVADVISELKNAESDMHYWQADTLIRERGGIKNRIKRKLKI